MVADNIKIGLIFCIFKYVEYSLYKEVYLKLDMLRLLKMSESSTSVEDGNCFFLFKENDFKCGVICYGGKRSMNVLVQCEQAVIQITFQSPLLFIKTFN